MSSSDAAPLPRLGEVFFDVRGDSRSMRLSWYADTGIAVFSIWHGGRCTGTFRLPMEDLARMTEILQRGPQRQRGGSRPDYERGGYDPAGYADSAGYEPSGYHDAGYDEDDWFDEEGRPAGGHVPGQDELTRAYPDRAGANRPSPGQDSAGYGPSGGHPDSAGYGPSGGHPDSAGYGPSGGHADSAGYGPSGGHADSAGYGPSGGHPDSAGYERSGGYTDSEGYERSGGYTDSAGYERSGRRPDSAGFGPSGGYADFPADAGASNVTGRYEFPARAVRPEDGSYLPGANDHDGGAVTDLSSYGQQRFVPPYVRPGAESYSNDNPMAGPARRHDAGGPAYPADQAAYGGSDWPAADPGVTAQYSAGRHGGRRARSSAESPFGEAELDAPGERISERDYWSRQAR